MSLSKRLFNVARAEINDLFRKMKDDDLSAEELRAIEEEIQSKRAEFGSMTLDEELTVEVSRYYANLELPVGASAAEVRAQYRRLMRRYHPDKHHGDDSKQRVATELAQELRTAYDALLEHLED